MANTIRSSLKKLFLLSSVICSPFFIQAQVFENFSDGDFRANPQWFGDTNQFIVNENNQLQLHANDAGTSMLLTQNACLNNCEWKFYIRLSFSPSANNNARVYLCSDQADLSTDLNGYFLQFGESGSGDAIELFRQNGQNTTSICRGTESGISTSFKLNIKVTHKSDGSWQIFIDNLDGSGFRLEATGIDYEFTIANYFGFFCTYTSSNAQKFYFDDILISQTEEPAPEDSIPPEVLSFNCLSENELELLFSENLTHESAKHKINYWVSDGIGNPDSIIFTDNQKVKLHFTKAFENRKTHTLFIKNITDLAENPMRDTALIFSYFEALPLDIVFNEIMDDPSPSVGLPEFEYFELKNTSTFDFNLKEWKIEINEKTKSFEEIIIPANGYLIVCGSDGAEELSAYGLVYSMPGLTLPNSGSTLILKNENGNLIHSFTYQKSLFSNTEKKDGGWSIEQINYTNSCLGFDNWNYSTALVGGSPGQENAVFSTSKPIPQIESFERLNEHGLFLKFTTSMDTSSLKEYSNYELVETGEKPIQIILAENEQKSVELIFQNVFQVNQILTLKVFSELRNCLGMHLAEDYFFSFVIPNKAELNDIVINEILYQPLNQGEEYIELYNRSEKILDFSDLEICLIKNDFPQPSDTICALVSNESKMFYPGSYFVLSRSPEKILAQYHSENPDNFLVVDELPRLVDNGALLILKNHEGMFIDKVEYDDKMHYPLLNFTEGVALEKIHFNLPGYVKSNWMSASFASGFGTPAYENSQFSEFSNQTSQITISPHVFTPDNDGRDDFLKIEYQLEKSGYTANVIIFNSEGIRIKQIVKNELLGTKGSFYWKGLDENSEKMPRGIYIVFVELFDLNGNVKHFKETAVLAEAF